MDSIFSLFSGFDPTFIKSWAEGFFQYEFTKMTLCFSIAAWLHRLWVRGEFKKYFSEMVGMKAEIVLLKEGQVEISGRMAAVESIIKPQITQQEG